MAEEKKSQQEQGKGSAEASAKPTKAKKRTVKVDAIGEAHIHAAFNNIIITLTNMKVSQFKNSSYTYCRSSF